MKVLLLQFVLIACTFSAAPAFSETIEFAEGDEAPILTSDSGQPIRQDKISQNKLIYFSGFNEE